MYINIGTHFLPADEVIGFFDIDETTVCKRTRDYLAHAERQGQVQSSFELPRSFVVCSRKDEKENRVFLSPVSVQTLGKRLR